MIDNNFEPVLLGQTIIRYRTPEHVFNEINLIYKKLVAKNKLPHMRKLLAGKIGKEYSLFWNSRHENRLKRHNTLSENVHNFFKEKFTHYLNFNKVQDWKFKVDSIWVNEMKAGEYNPIHIHAGDLYTGLSSVMILKLPKNFGKEWQNPQDPMNGQLTFMGNSTGYFSISDYTPSNLRPGDFFIFPYDIRHTVYPFQGKYKRITLSANADVSYNPLSSTIYRQSQYDKKN